MKLNETNETVNDFFFWKDFELFRIVVMISRGTRMILSSSKIDKMNSKNYKNEKKMVEN